MRRRYFISTPRAQSRAKCLTTPSDTIADVPVAASAITMPGSAPNKIPDDSVNTVRGTGSCVNPT